AAIRVSEIIALGHDALGIRLVRSEGPGVLFLGSLRFGLDARGFLGALFLDILDHWPKLALEVRYHRLKRRIDRMLSTFLLVAVRLDCRARERADVLIFEARLEVVPIRENLLLERRPELLKLRVICGRFDANGRSRRRRSRRTI